MIAIGAEFGGPEHNQSAVASAVRAAMNVAILARDPAYKDRGVGWINPIFLVPGSVHGPDFAGLRLGHFSRGQRGLVVMVAVPESIDSDTILPFICASLREAVQLASARFARSDIPFDTAEAERIVLAIEEAGKKKVLDSL